MLPSPKRLAAVALAAAACTLVPTGAWAGVVVSASGPSAGSFPAGKSIGNSERIVLRAGDTLTVLDGNGTRVLRGAGTYTLSQQAGKSQPGAFAELTQRRTGPQTRTGAVRCPEGDASCLPPRPSSLWYVDVSHPGTVCVTGSDRVRLWRPEKDGAATYSLRAAAGGASHEVTFGDGDALALWDAAALPIADGASFALSGPHEGTLKFAMLGTPAEEPEALAQQLIAKGCTQQLEVLSAVTMVEEGQN